MAEWLFRAGLVFAIVGFLLLTPLADLLPLDLWFWVKGLLQPKGTHLHLKVVAGNSSNAIEYSLIAFGVAMAVVGYYLKGHP